MKRPCAGFILVITLSIIAVISLLLLTGMQHILLYGKAINRQELTHQTFYQMEYLAKELADSRGDLMVKECINEDDNPNKVIRKLMNHKGCSVIKEARHYQYFIEDLGEYPCVTVWLNQKLHSSHHIRITLLLIADADSPLSSVLQIRYIKAIPALSCLDEVQNVSVGVNSWRYFLDYNYKDMAE